MEEGLNELVEAFTHPLTGVKLGDHRYKLKLYRDVFIGQEAVTWICNYKNVDRKEALRLGQAIMNLGVFNHVHNAHPFEDGYLFYNITKPMACASGACKDDLSFENCTSLEHYHPAWYEIRLACAMCSDAYESEIGDIDKLLPEDVILARKKDAEERELKKSKRKLSKAEQKERERKASLTTKEEEKLVIGGSRPVKKEEVEVKQKQDEEQEKEERERKGKEEEEEEQKEKKKDDRKSCRFAFRHKKKEVTEPVIARPFMGGKKGDLYVKKLALIGKFDQVLIGVVELKKLPKVFVVQEKGYQLYNKPEEEKEKEKENEQEREKEAETGKEEPKQSRKWVRSGGKPKTELGPYTVVENRYTIVIRGTANFNDVLTDLRFNKVKNEALDGQIVHEGFAYAACKLYESFKANVAKSLPPDATISVTGHSLGGAVAVLFAVLLKNDKDCHYNIKSVITFGQPMITDRKGAMHWNTGPKAIPLFRLWNDKDPVPTIPPHNPFSCLLPHGSGCYYQFGHLLRFVEGGQQLEISEASLAQPELELQVEHHTLANPSRGYVASILSRELSETRTIFGDVTQWVRYIMTSPFLAEALRKAMNVLEM